MTKACPKCGETDLAKFSKDRKRPDGLQGCCKECSKAYRISWRARNPEKLKIGRREYRWSASGFVMTVEEYETRFVEQKSLCALCFEPFDEKNLPAVDHDHVTGNVRALLHNRCNAAIGLFGDDLEKIRLAVAYLERHIQKP